MSDPKSDLAVWLEFIRALFWPITVLIGLGAFRKQLQSLLNRVSSFKVGDTEMAFQAPSPDAKLTTPIKAADIVDTGLSQRLTESGIRDAVRETGQLLLGEEPYRSMQIFSTKSQTTWLVFSKSKIFCVLDDDSTRKSGRLIQWVLPTATADPIHAREKRAGIGLIDIGDRRNWLYSTSLFSSPELIRAEVGRALAEAEVQN